jgi:hypothetical protein
VGDLVLHTIFEDLSNLGNLSRPLQAKPYLEAIGKGVLDVGDRTRSSGALKLIGNFFVSSMIELIAEGTALADKNDIPQSALLEVLNLLYPSPIVEVSCSTVWRSLGYHIVLFFICVGMNISFASSLVRF